jgi:serine-type D-Ala-D-Ala carboxypeptidase (penicillin-binding protein 5/6)
MSDTGDLARLHLLNSSLMNDKDTSERRAYTDEERRHLIEERIRELRRKKRREQRRENRRTRLIFAAILSIFLLIFLFTGVYSLASSGEEERYHTIELEASNLAEFDERSLAPQEISVPAIAADAAILIDPFTGDVLYEMNADLPLPMASTTKIMTAIVVLENASLDENVTVSDYAATVGEASAWLERGEVLTVEQLLYALLLQSANDASVALAEHVGGSKDAFVDMMNAEARDMGLENTSFANTHGLDEQGHYTSARDLSTISAYALRIPKFREIVVTESYEIPWPGNPFPRVFSNRNKLLSLYPCATGIKTGYTLGAGKCLAAAAEKEGRELVSVILDGGDSYWDQTISLMEYGFNDFTRVEFAYSGQSLAEVEVGDFPRRKVNAVGSGDLVFTVRRDRLDDYRKAAVCSLAWMPYPVAAGQEVGYMIVAEGTPRQTREMLVSDASRNTPNFLLRVLAFLGTVFTLWWNGILWLIPGL